MGDSGDDVLYNLFPLVKVYKNGRVERLCGTNIVPPAATDSDTGVRSKDVEISPDPKLSVRLYLPETAVSGGRKLPLLVYFHGGGFVVESAFSPTYQKPLTLLAAEAEVVITSVDFRLAPEHPLPAAYDDGWTTLEWVASAAGGGGEEWLREYVDFDRVFLGGDSVGANISHNLAMRIGSGSGQNLNGLKLKGLFFNCPFFWGKDRIGDEGQNPLICAFVENTWRVAHPNASDMDDPDINPEKNPDLGKLGCKRVIIFAPEKDPSKHRAWLYKEALVKSGWGGEVEVVEVKGESHIFNLISPTCDSAMAMLKKLATFFHNDKS